MISLESANNQSAESLSSYKKSLDDDLEVYKDNSKRLAEESKRARINQVKSDCKKQLASSQMAIKKGLTKKQSEIKVKVFVIVQVKKLLITELLLNTLQTLSIRYSLF